MVLVNLKDIFIPTVSLSQHHRTRIPDTGRRLRSLDLRLLLLSLRLLLLGRSLQGAHLARLHTGDLLLAHVHPTVRIAQPIVRHVLLLERLQLARLFACQLVQIVRCDLRPANGQIHRRSDLRQFDARRLQTGFLQQNLVRSKQNLVVIGGGETDHMLDALQPNRVDRVPMECVDEQRFETAQLFGLRPLRAVEDQTRLDACGDFLVLELAQTLVLFDAQLDHVEQFVLKHTAEDQVVGALLRGGTEQEQGAVVLLGEAVRKRENMVLQQLCAAMCAGLYTH